MQQLYLHEGIDKAESFVFFFISDHDLQNIKKYGSWTFICFPYAPVHDYKEIVGILLDRCYLNGKMYLFEIIRSFYDELGCCPSTSYCDHCYIQLVVKLIEEVNQDTYLVENVEKRALLRNESENDNLI